MIALMTTMKAMMAKFGAQWFGMSSGRIAAATSVPGDPPRASSNIARSLPGSRSRNAA
jgi:hypothetical protein